MAAASRPRSNTWLLILAVVLSAAMWFVGGFGDADTGGDKATEVQGIEGSEDGDSEPSPKRVGGEGRAPSGVSRDQIANAEKPKEVGLFLEFSLSTPTTFADEPTRIVVIDPATQKQQVGAADAEGKATIDATKLIRTNGASVVLRLRLDHPDHVPYVASAVIEPRISMASRRAKITAPIAITLEPATRRIHGTVRVPRGSKVGGVHVAMVGYRRGGPRALVGRTTTDSAGRYHLRGRVEERCVVVAWRPGLRALRPASVSLRSHESTATVDLVLEGGAVVEGVITHDLPLSQLDAVVEFHLVSRPRRPVASRLPVGRTSSSSEAVEQEEEMQLEREFSEDDFEDVASGQHRIQKDAIELIVRPRWFTELEWSGDAFDFAFHFVPLDRSGRFRVPGLIAGATYRVHRVHLGREDHELGHCPLPLLGAEKPFRAPVRDLSFTMNGRLVLFRCTFEGENRLPFHPISMQPGGASTSLDGAGQVVFASPFGDRPGDVTLRVEGFADTRVRAVPGDWQVVDVVRRARRR